MYNRLHFSKTKLYVSQLLNAFLFSTPAILIFSVVILFYQMHYPYWISQALHGFNFAPITELILVKVVGSLWYLFLIPTFFVTCIWRKKLKTIGLQQPPHSAKALISTALALALLLFLAWLMTKTSFMNIAYTLPTLSARSIFFLFLVFPIYYFAEEFFFRGFLFLTLWEKVGWHSFWITDIIFMLSHLGKPPIEILICIPASIIFNVVTLLTRSIYPAIFIHTSIGILCLMLMNLPH